jgi:hypothetical protein
MRLSQQNAQERTSPEMIGVILNKTWELITSILRSLSQYIARAIILVEVLKMLADTRQIAISEGAEPQRTV